jgi:hypothetical protein
MDEQDLQAVAEEFVPDEGEIVHQIEAEWEARSQRGETIPQGRRVRRCTSGG